MMAILCWLAIPVVIFTAAAVGHALLRLTDKLPDAIGYGLGCAVILTFFFGGCFTCFFLLYLGGKLWGAA